MGDDDPLSHLAEGNYSMYQFIQVSFAVSWVLYTALCGFAVTLSDNTAGRCVELIFVIWIGVLYYFLVWTPAMVDEMPRVNAWMKEYGKDYVKGVDTPMFALLPYYSLALFFAILLGIDTFAGSPNGKINPDDP